MHHDSDISNPAGLAGRFDIYGPIHKGLRRAQGEMLVRLGNADYADPAVTSTLFADLRNLIALAADHVSHEEHHIHRALETQAPDEVSRLSHQHDGHAAHFNRLEALIGAVEAASSTERTQQARALYLAFCGYCAEDLEHMNEEETVAWPILCEIFTDDELAAIEMEIVGSLPPEKAIVFMQIMIPAMNPQERAGLLNGMKANAPAEAFDAVIEFAARPTLSPEEFERLTADLDLAA